MVMWLDGSAIVSVNQRKKVEPETTGPNRVLTSINPKGIDYFWEVLFQDLPEVVDTQQDIWRNVATDGKAVWVNAECAECVFVFFTETIWFELGS
ncbi:hypothetical protein RB195_014697 [Necator americanus]|uniref:Uncharacterized protein n=1 Tax=Necator americanus TaxID=51031 RepID=A0ABR1E1M6_NECAM